MGSENEETPLTNIEEFKASAITGIKTGTATAGSLALGVFTGTLVTKFAAAASNDNFAQWAPGAITTATTIALGLLALHKVSAFSGETNRFKTYGATMLLAGILTMNGLGAASNYATKKITQASSSFLADPELKNLKPINETEIKTTVANTKIEKIKGQHKFIIK